MDLNMIKNKLDSLQPKESKKKGEKVDYTKLYWKPREEGKYQIRIVPSKYNKKWPFKEVYLHYGLSKYSIYALTNWDEKDPIVEFTKQLRDTRDSENWKLAKKLDPKMRVFAQVLVRGEEEKGVRLWEFGKNIYQQLLSLADDSDYGDYTDINEGLDFTVETKYGDVGGRQVLLSTITPRRKSTPISEDADQIKEWLDNQNDILELQSQYKKSFDSLKTILSEYLNPEEGKEGEVTSDKPSDFDDDLTKKSDSNYSLSKKDVTTKTQKFDELFDEEEENDLPF